MSDNLEREVEEILRKLDNFVPEEGPLSRTRRRVGQAASDVFRAVVVRLSRISLGQVMLVSALLIAGAFFFGRARPGASLCFQLSGGFLSGLTRNELRDGV